MTNHIENLPSYESPPIAEVVCGTTFKPIGKLTAPYLGLYWQKIRTEFPNHEQQAPIPALVERFGDSEVVTISDLSAGTNLPRIWFIGKDECQLIQVQRDRFLFNWRKLKTDDVYPRFSTVYRDYSERFTGFLDFLREQKLSATEKIQYELTYTNHIVDGWEGLGKVGKVLPDFDWRVQQNRFLPNPSGIAWMFFFDLPGNQGRLHVKVQNGHRRSDDKKLLRIELTVRGFSKDEHDWFQQAHVWIVKAFEDLTGNEMQLNVWRKKT